MQWLKVWAGRLAMFFALRLGLYYSFSRLWRDTVESEWADALITRYSKVENLYWVLGRAKWRPDRKFLDVISWPGKAEHDYLNTGYLGDCDEFAVYAATALHNIRDGNHDPSSVGILTVTWWSPHSGYGGHNAAAYALRGSQQWCHLSNWNGGFPVGDGPREPIFTSPAEMAKAICEDVNGICLGWALVETDLSKVLQYGMNP